MSIGQNIFEKNKIYHGDCLEIMKLIPNERIDLCIIDPPYFRIVNHKWDKFKNKELYNKFTEEYVSELKRIMRLNGTILLFGCTRNFNTLASINNILENNCFEFIQEIILDKGMKSIAGRISNKIKMLPPVSENIIVYRKDAKPFVKKILLNKQKEFGYSSIQIKEKLGMALNGGGNWTKYTGNTEFALFPTKEFWSKLCETFSINIEYEKIKETYNGIYGLTNVWDDLDFYMKPRLHPTQKPLNLIERCVNIFSDETDTVLDIFAGSSTTAIACIKTNRDYIMIEKEEQYYNLSLKRVGDFLNSFSHETSNEDEK